MPPMSERMLELDAVEVRYGSVPAVRNLSLQLDRGEIVGLIGPNGAGKSTTLAAVMGLVPVYGGEIRLRGKKLAGSPEQIARSGVALVPEGRHIFASLTVEENLRLGLAARRSRERLGEDLAWVRSLFPVVEEFSARPAGSLSGGQQQQLAIARALVAAPDLLLLDEPSLGLAPTVVETVFAALAQVRDHGVTILLVEQRGALTVAFADRTLVLANAELRLTLRAEDAASADELTAKLTAAYLS
jgi:branched-chain amino acid transport system ATP-binding protein